MATDGMQSISAFIVFKARESLAANAGFTLDISQTKPALAALFDKVFPVDLVALFHVPANFD